MTLENNIFFVLFFLTVAFCAAVLSYAAWVLNKNSVLVRSQTVGKITFQHIEAGAVFHALLAALVLLGLITQSLNITLNFGNLIANVIMIALVASYLWMVIGLTRHAWLWAGRVR